MDIKEQTARLATRRAELVGEMQGIERQLDAPAPSDWEDRAVERQGDEVLETRGQADQTELRRIDAALARIEDGIYGDCVRCGSRIADARLTAIPEAALCRDCAGAGPRAG